MIDFGLATNVAPGEVLNRHVGTPYYIAPEVCGRDIFLLRSTVCGPCLIMQSLPPLPVSTWTVPCYLIPPTQVLDKRYGMSCDLWSVGVITFTLLCGFPPFWGDTEREIYGRE